VSGSANARRERTALWLWPVSQLGAMVFLLG
jgi:hypothetical protein